MTNKDFGGKSEISNKGSDFDGAISKNARK